MKKSNYTLLWVMVAVAVIVVAVGAYIGLSNPPPGTIWQWLSQLGG